MEHLTVKEYSELCGCTQRWVRKLISEGDIPAEVSFGNGGTSGKKYLIPLSEIAPRLQKKYMRLHKEKFPELQKAAPAPARDRGC